MVKRPKFSIIIPVYNVENYLSQCLDSVINQTISDIEIICVNDGTKDRSRCVLEKYQKKDDRIQIIDKENGGLSSARNAGLQVATGEYIIFVDSDDYIGNTTCERLYYEILDQAPDIIVFGSYVFPHYLKPEKWLTNNLSVQTKIYCDGGMEPLLNENGAYPFVWRDCFKREFLAQHNLFFDETVRYAEDLIFQFISFPLAKKLVFIEDKLYYYRWSRTNSLMENASKNLYKKYSFHIDAMYKIADFWRENGFLNHYSSDFMKWTVSFMGWDLHNYSGYAKEELVCRVQAFWNQYDLNRHTKKLDAKEKHYYNHIVKSAKTAQK